MKRSIVLYPLLLSVFFFLSACSKVIVADYDAEIEKEIFRIAKEVDVFYVTMYESEARQRNYNNFREQYIKIETDIQSLYMKNQVRPLNNASSKQAGIALDLWMDFKGKHKAKDGIKDILITRHRDKFRRIFTAMALGENIKGTVKSEK